jgi:hypothetical protein
MKCIIGLRATVEEANMINCQGNDSRVRERDEG